MSRRALELGLDKLSVLRVDAGVPRQRDDWVAVEEPLTMRIAGDPLATTMRTPGQDHELCAGFLLAEGLIHHRDDLTALRPCFDPETGTSNVIDAVPAPGVVIELDGEQRRGTVVTSACGLCGRLSIDELRERLSAIDDDTVFAPQAVLSAVSRLRDHQPNFKHSGGLHAAGLASADGSFSVVREDVGRHNAVDKVLGRALLDDRLPLRGSLLLVSGRISFEIVQKACTAGIPLVAGISAPTSLAVECASALSLTLVGFAREHGLTVYAHPQRLGF